MNPPDQLTLDVVEICRRASAAILDVYNRDDFKVATKSDESPLTAADLASHRVVTRALEQLTPDIPVLSEESSETVMEERRGWQRLWLVDPLDGTKEFIKRNGEFTVNVALIENHRPVLGVIAIPVHDVYYAARIPGGAWKINSDGGPEAIGTRIPAPETLTVMGSRSHGNERTQEYLDRVGPHELMGRGSALKFCAVAEGQADFYPRLGPTSEWDTAAGHCIVEAAGGKIVRADGDPLTYNARDTLLNPEFLVIGDPGRDWPLP